MELARSLHLTTVAEGIEHAHQAETLLSLGCDLGQGYLFARPLQAPDLAAIVVGRQAAAAARGTASLDRSRSDPGAASSVLVHPTRSVDGGPGLAPAARPASSLQQRAAGDRRPDEGACDQSAEEPPRAVAVTAEQVREVHQPADGPWTGPRRTGPRPSPDARSPTSARRSGLRTKRRQDRDDADPSHATIDAGISAKSPMARNVMPSWPPIAAPAHAPRAAAT